MKKLVLFYLKITFIHTSNLHLESKTPELEEKDVQTLTTLVKDNLQNTTNLAAALQFIGDLGRQGTIHYGNI